MPRVHVLTPGFQTPNGRAFLFPLIVWRRELDQGGIQAHFFDRSTAGVTDCDVLLVDSKFHRDRWANERDAVLAEFARWADICRVIYCDTTNSSGSLQAELLPIVHVYGKSQVLADRSHYLRPLYGQRLYADYYHRTFGIEDVAPEWSAPVQRESDLGKIRVSWNSGLADYSFTGPTRMALYNRVPVPFLLRFPAASAAADDPRPQDVSCRFGAAYPRASVAYQRQQIRNVMADQLDTLKLSRRRYFAELRASKVVVSPFGFGEITLKDFEVFLTGGLLLKPDMNHMQTWPDLFRAGDNMVTHAWDLSDFEETLSAAIADAPSASAMAQRGQDAYRRHTSGADAAALFLSQLRSVIA